MSEFTAIDYIQIGLLLVLNLLLLFLYGSSVIVTLYYNYKEYKRKREWKK